MMVSNRKIVLVSMLSLATMILVLLLISLESQAAETPINSVPGGDIATGEPRPLSDPATCIVTSIANKGPGTLRQCLLSAGMSDTITFSPTVFNPATITLTSPLPEIITDGLTIDGDGASVILNGNYPFLTEAHGLRIAADSVTIRKLQIMNFDWSGIKVTSGSGNTIEGNVIVANQNHGIKIVGPTTGTIIISNSIGTDTDGILNLGNRLHGIIIQDGAQGNIVGPGNKIAYNGRDGVRVEGATTLSNTITQNSITANDDLGINNVDGGNGELTPPTIVTVTGTTIQGKAQSGATVELFTDPFFEGERFVVSTTADGGGNFTVTLTTPLTVPLVTATSTDAAGNTSEFGVFCRAEVFESPIIWPYCDTEPSPISSPFGPRLMASQDYRYDFHRGVDLPAPPETPFFAVADGIVIEVVTDPPDGTIRISHTDPMTTYYSHYRHVSQTLVTTGQVVSKGMLIGSTGQSASGFAHLHFEIRDEPGEFEKYSVNPFGRMPYSATDDYEIEISQVSVDPTNPSSPTTVLLEVIGPRQELDLNRFTVAVEESKRVLGFNNLNRTRTPAPNNTDPDVLDNPYQDDICIMPARFNTSSDVYRLNLAFHRMPGTPPTIVTAQAADLFSKTVTATLLASRELLLTPAVVTATTPTGRWVTHTHTLTNPGSITQVYALTARSAQSWTVTIEPIAVTVASGESVTFTTSISVPDNGYVVDGTIDCVVVEISSSVGEVYLPLILKKCCSP